MIFSSVRRPRLRELALGAGAALGALVLAGCAPTGQPSQPTPAASTPAVTRGLVAIGDSLTAATNSCGKHLHCPANSWATGTNAQVNSVVSRLSDAQGELPTVNLAVAGTKLAGLGPQLQTALGYHPQYLTVLIGGNDFCTPDVAAMTPVASFKQAAAKLIDAVHTESPGTQVLMPSLIDPMAIYQAGAQSAAAQAAWRRGQVCQSLLAEPLDQSASAQARRAAVRERAVAFNAALSEVCAAAANCRTDGGELFKVRFTPADISKVDYFHPSLSGQRAMAQAIWAGTSK